MLAECQEHMEQQRLMYLDMIHHQKKKENGPTLHEKQPRCCKGGEIIVCFAPKKKPPTQRFAVDSLPLAQEIALALAAG